MNFKTILIAKSSLFLWKLVEWGELLHVLTRFTIWVIHGLKYLLASLQFKTSLILFVFQTQFNSRKPRRALWLVVQPSSGKPSHWQSLQVQILYYIYLAFSLCFFSPFPKSTLLQKIVKFLFVELVRQRMYLFTAWLLKILSKRKLTKCWNKNNPYQTWVLVFRKVGSQNFRMKILRNSSWGRLEKRKSSLPYFVCVSHGITWDHTTLMNAIRRQLKTTL
jgi:hypothetical protein